MFLSPELLFAISSVPDSRRWLPLAAERSAGHGPRAPPTGKGRRGQPQAPLRRLEKTSLCWRRPTLRTDRESSLLGKTVLAASERSG